ncbi:MAG: hypothetical protein NT099_03015 [Candidatus Saganbacteria bacterium]|nr:hypothetical protein [Candidatus Saganbacteria bacterium]
MDAVSMARNVPVHDRAMPKAKAAQCYSMARAVIYAMFLVLLGGGVASCNYDPLAGYCKKDDAGSCIDKEETSCSFPKGEPTEPIVLEDFSPVTNSTSKCLRGEWVGFNGFFVAIMEGTLHAEGAGSWPGFNILVGGSVEGLDVSKYSKISFKVRQELQTEEGGEVDIKVEVYSRHPNDQPDPVASGFFTAQKDWTTVEVDLNGAEHLKQFQVMVASHQATGWVEIDDITLVP